MFMELLGNAVERAMRSHRLLGAMFLDLDCFKLVSDSPGQDAGDRILAKAVHRLDVSLREGDTVCRMDSDQFTVIAENLAAPEEAPLVAEPFSREFSNPVKVGGDKIAISMSVVIAIFPADAQDTSQPVQKADTAMAKAKELGETLRVLRWCAQRPDDGTGLPGRHGTSDSSRWAGHSTGLWAVPGPAYGWATGFGKPFPAPVPLRLADRDGRTDAQRNGKGIETAEQAYFLRKIGGDEKQE